MRHRNALWTLIILAASAASACPSVEAKLTCETDSDCFEGYACDTLVSKKCLRACTSATEEEDCLASQYCDVPAGESKGVCRDGPQPGDGGGDPGAGDPTPGDPNPGD